MLEKTKNQHILVVSLNLNQVKSKINWWYCRALSLASIVLLSVFAGINKTPLELTKSTHDTTRIYFRVEKIVQLIYLK